MPEVTQRALLLAAWNQQSEANREITCSTVRRLGPAAVGAQLADSLKPSITSEVATAFLEDRCK